MANDKSRVINIYNSVLNGDIKCFPRGFWVGADGRENATICTRYLIENILCFDKQHIRKKLTLSCFIKNKLAGMIRTVYNDSPYLALNSVYPHKFLPWDLKWCPMSYWSQKENRVKAFLWLLDICDIDDNNILNTINAKLFREYGLTGLIDKYNGRLYDLIIDLHPSEDVKNKYNKQ